MTKPQFTLIPSAYRVNTVYSVLPVDGSGDMTFSRVGEATRVREDGLIETVDSNVPRLDWLNSNCPSLLLEPTTTNYAINSSNASLWANVFGSQSVTKTQNYAISPDGTHTAARIQATSTGSNYSLIELSTSSFIGNYSGSVYLKSNTGNTENVIVYGRNTSVISYEVGSEWRRIDLQGSGTTGENLYLFIGSFPSNGSDETIDISVWGGQLEQGEFATSFIKTQTNPTTRSTDVTSGVLLPYNKSEGTMFLDIKAFNNDGINSSIISLNDMFGANQISFYFSTNNNLFILINNAYASPIASYTYIHDGERQKYAVKWQGDNYYIYINGLLVISATNTGRTFSNLTNFNFANNYGSNNFQGEVYNTQIFDNALSNDEIINLTK